MKIDVVSTRSSPYFTFAVKPENDADRVIIGQVSALQSDKLYTFGITGVTHAVDQGPDQFLAVRGSKTRINDFIVTRK